MTPGANYFEALVGGTDPALVSEAADRAAQLLVRGTREAGATQLRRYPTYLTALEQRREKLPGQVGRDRQLMDQISDLQQSYLHQVDALPPGRPPGAQLREVRWMLEEYRVSLWAQQLGTAYPVSDHRIRRSLQA